MSLFGTHDHKPKAYGSAPENGFLQPQFVPIFILLFGCMPLFFISTPRFLPFGIGIQLIGIISVLILKFKKKMLPKGVFITCMALFAVLAAILIWARYCA